MFDIPSDACVRYFRQGMKRWRENESLREYPWRISKDPFKLFITEILLRRTRADTVAYNWDHIFSIISSFADIRDIDHKDLENLIRPLGLFRIRCINLKSISTSLKNRVPCNEEKLMVLPGVGKYIARIYLLMRYNKRGLIFDTNFRRLYSRYFGIEILKDLKHDRIIEPLSDIIIPKKDVRLFILTVLDFASLVCKPINPICKSCELKSKCSKYNRS